MLIFGNKYELIKNPKKSRDGQHLNKHKWTVFVKFESEEIQKK